MASAFSGVGDITVGVKFCIKNGNGGRAVTAIVVKFVTTGYHSDATGLSILGGNVAHKIRVGYFAT